MSAHHLIHISDSHLHVDAPAMAVALSCMVDRINALIAGGVPVDLVVHTGDLTDDGDAPGSDGRSAHTAAACLSRLDAPLLTVGGNHDRRCWLQDAFGDARLGAPLAAGLRQAQVAGLDCLLLDANPENGQDDLSGRIDDALLAALEQALQTRQHRVLLLMHYPPAAMTTDGWMEPVIGGEALHMLLARHAGRLHAVLHGHVHQASVRQRDGVLYVSAPGCRRHFLHWPAAKFADRRDERWGFNYLQIDATGTQVHYHGLAVS